MDENLKIERWVSCACAWAESTKHKPKSIKSMRQCKAWNGKKQSKMNKNAIWLISSKKEESSTVTSAPKQESLHQSIGTSCSCGIRSSCKRRKCRHLTQLALCVYKRGTFSIKKGKQRKKHKGWELVNDWRRLHYKQHRETKE